MGIQRGRHKGINQSNYKDMAHGQRARYDYRNDYKGMSITQLELALSKAKDKLIFWTGLDKTEERNWFKRVCYLKAKLEKF